MNGENNQALLIKNGTVVTLDRENTIIENGGILIRDGRLDRIGRSADLEKGYTGPVLEAKKGLVMPGLVNAHTHLPMSLFRGLADDLPLMTWLNEHMFPAEARYINPETVRLGTLLSCAEMLLSGTTCCCDGYFFEDQVAEAVLESGMRAVLAQGVIDFPAPGVPDPASNVEHAAQCVGRWKDRDPRIRPSIFCHSPYTCSDMTLKKAKKAACDAGVLFQIHVAETRGEWDQIRNEKGLSPVMYLDHLGILDERTLLVHGVHVDDQDLDIIAARGASLAHAPESNMKLASGVAPIPGYVSRGIACGLGTDGSASNNNLDLFSEMDTTAKLHKVHHLDPTVMDARTVLHMATLGGAGAMGLADEIGSLEPGKYADVIILDTDKPHLVPMYNPVSHLVYSAMGSDVRDVVVNGRLVVENRRLLTMDLATVISQARDFGEKLMSDKRHL